MIEDHTRDNLAIRAKEAQLVRSRSDAEQAESQVVKLQRENDRLKRELARSIRTASPPPNEMDEHMYNRNSVMNGGYGSSSMGQNPRESAIGRNSKRLSYASNFSTEENQHGNGGYERSKMVSPTFSTMSGMEGRGSPSRLSTSDNAESWKRAAEVTNALKARIEQMKRQNGIGRGPN